MKIFLVQILAITSVCLGTPHIGFAQTFIHRGTDSSCRTACADAKNMAKITHEVACPSGYRVLLNSAPKCKDGGCYDIDCTFSSRITCTPKVIEDRNEYVKFKVIYAVCGELDHDLVDQCLLLGQSSEQKSILQGVLVNQGLIPSELRTNPLRLRGKSIQLEMKSLSVMKNRNFESNVFGPIGYATNISPAIDPRIDARAETEKTYQILHATCGEISLSLGDQCVFLARNSANNVSVLVADFDETMDSLGTVDFNSDSRLKWVRFDGINLPILGLEDTISTYEAIVQSYVQLKRFQLVD